MCVTPRRNPKKRTPVSYYVEQRETVTHKLYKRRSHSLTCNMKIKNELLSRTWLRLPDVKNRSKYNIKWLTKSAYSSTFTRLFSLSSTLNTRHIKLDIYQAVESPPRTTRWHYFWLRDTNIRIYENVSIPKHPLSKKWLRKGL